MLADATLCLARGEALQRCQTHDPATTRRGYLERCALKTGKLFEAACLLGSAAAARSASSGSRSAIAFQITDDILDCSGETIETGKIAGTDLREGTPTLPLLLAAREDEVVRARARRRAARRRARSASPRPARSSAPARSRSTYARSARACLNGEVAPRGAGGAHPRRREQGALSMAHRERTDTLAPIREKVEAASGSTSRTALALMESDDLLALGELADLARRAARRRRPRSSSSRTST